LDLPPFPDLTAEVLDVITTRHGVASVARLPEVGIFNAVFLLGEDLVLRVPRDHPNFIAAALKEAIAAPAARAAGVHTPRLVDFDDRRDLLPVPFLVYERVRGEPLGGLDLEPACTPEVWRVVGRDLALVHTGIAAEGPVAELEVEVLDDDPRLLAEDAAAVGQFTGVEARWLTRWLDELAPAALTPVTECLLHGDVQATNVMVASGSLEYLALIDWGSAGWGDPAWDFAGFPLRAVPWVLAGHREVAPVDGDETVEARILWRHLQLSLWLLRRSPQPGRSWAERPVAMFTEVLRFFLEGPGDRWRKLAPPAGG
jgi:aminoglycoside phosphotransferase (APT) family kinase protein